MIFTCLLERTRKLVGTVIAIQIVNPEIKASKITVRRIVRVATQVSEVMQENQGTIILFFNEPRMIDDLQ